MSGSSMATYFMVSLILLISAFIIGVTLSDQQQQTHPIVGSSSSTFNIFKKEEASSEQQFQNIFEALMATQDYSNWAEVLSITDPFTFPITATFLIPGDNPLINTSSSSSSSSQSLITSTIGYHIIPQQLPFSLLQTFAIGSRIPTLLPEKTILVTNNSQSNFTIDGIQITYPDLYINGAVVVHGIKSTLNYTAFGAANAKDDDHDTSDDPFSDNDDDDDKKKNETSTSAEGNGGKGGERVSSDGTKLTFKKRVFLGISWIMIYTCFSS